MDITAKVKVAWISSLANFGTRYEWVMSNLDVNVAKELRQTGVKKYWQSIDQIKIELDWQYDSIPVLAIFVRYLYRIYKNEEVGRNISIK